MTDRDVLATAAMPIFLRHALAIEDGYSPAVVALQAYRLADAMLRERDRPRAGEACRPALGCINGFRLHRWDPITLTCFRCHAPAPPVQRMRARQIGASKPPLRKVVSLRG